MVAVIKPGQSIRRILNYNELKVKGGVADCLEAINYPIDAEKMSFSCKLNHLTQRAALNDKVKINSMHISLNFDNSESRLPKDTLLAIAGTYMDQIGFGKQPYLVYQHFDAAHPHLHIVTTNIEADGKRIDLHHLGIRKSEPARKAIEKEFNLVVAEDQKKQQAYRLKPIVASKVTYGKSQTKMAIQNVLESVLAQYKYTTLPELNAILNQYNICAERGSADSRMYKKGGLQYRVLDQDDVPIGVPIKASLFYNKPTLKYLEQRFKDNVPKRLPYQGRVKNAIDKALFGRRVSLGQLKAQLEKQGIHAVLRSSEAGLVYGITYVDHQTKTVFNGSDLGKQYSAKGLQERCAPETHSPSERVLQSKLSPDKYSNAEHDVPANQNSAVQSMLQSLIDPEHTNENVPGHLMRKKKKKRGIKNWR